MSDPPFATLLAAVRAHAAQRPAHPALVNGTEVVTYGDLEQRTDRLAGTLVAAGAAEGARVAHLAHDSAAYLELLLACAKTGAVLVPVDRRRTVHEVEDVLTDSGARLLFTDAASVPAARRLTRILDHTVVLGTPEARRWWSGQPALRATPDDDQRPLVQLYPAGDVVSAGSFAGHRIDWRAGDRSLLGAPGYDAGGIWWATQGLRAGITTVVLPAPDCRPTAEAIHAHRITTAYLTPALLRTLVNEPGGFAPLRVVVHGGPPLSAPLLARCRASFGCEPIRLPGLARPDRAAA